MRKRIISILLFACGVTGIGVVQIMHSKGSEKQTEQTVTNQPIAFGSVYEITENNFVKGLDHDFTQEELEIWNEVYQDGSVQEEQGYLLDGAQKYMIHLYDADGNEVLEYVLDGNGQLYDGKKNGQAVRNETIKNMLEKIISKNNRRKLK